MLTGAAALAVVCSQNEVLLVARSRPAAYYINKGACSTSRLVKVQLACCTRRIAMAAEGVIALSGAGIVCLPCCMLADAVVQTYLLHGRTA